MGGLDEPGCGAWRIHPTMPARGAKPFRSRIGRLVSSRASTVKYRKPRSLASCARMETSA